MKGVLILPFSELKVGWPALRNPANVHKAMQPTPEQFHPFSREGQSFFARWPS